jgi:hypothetical protein
MQVTSVFHLIPVLQTAIGPMILISGVGLFLLTMTNRLGRLVDRSRLLKARLFEANGASRMAIEAQLHIFLERGRLLRKAIALITVSAFTAAILIIVLFFSALFEFHDAWLIGTLFIASMICLCFSLLLFIKDINQSLVALKLELNSEESWDNQQGTQGDQGKPA